MKSALYSIAFIAQPKPSDQPLAAEHNELFRHYPAHLHINILPSHQRRGHGRKLISAFLNQIRSQQEESGTAKGIQLVMAGNNAAGEKFYQSCGFRRFERVLDGGRSGEVGRDEVRIGEVNGHVWLCKEL
jgi:ribosomal protein S18 acetylase RimI-like enzyme